MFLIAKNYQNPSSSERAPSLLQGYKVGRPKAPSAQKCFDLKQARLDSLYNAAYLRETDNVTSTARRTTSARSRSTSSTPRQTLAEEAADAYFRIALIYKKLGKPTEMIQTFDRVEEAVREGSDVLATTGQNYVMTS